MILIGGLMKLSLDGYWVHAHCIITLVGRLPNIPIRTSILSWNGAVTNCSKVNVKITILLQMMMMFRPCLRDHHISVVIVIPNGVV